jgi:SAM-dependent methyltransferase
VRRARLTPLSSRRPRTVALRRVSLDSPAIDEGAALFSLGNGHVRVVTPAAAWHHAVGFSLGDAEPTAVHALVSCRVGEVGISVLAEDGSTPVASETIVPAGVTRFVTALLDRASEPGRWLMIRNGAAATASECDVFAVFTGDVPSVELTDADVARALRDPAAAKEHCVGQAWPEDVMAMISGTELPLDVAPPPAPLQLPPADVLWRGAMESVVLRSAQDIIRLLDTFQPQEVEPHVALLSDESMPLYLRMNVVRVVRLVESLRRRGVETGTVLEVGAWFGSFALSLRRLGYEVVAADRYESYGGAFASHVALMQKHGVTIVSTRREDELEQIASLGQFDVVLAGAVIEHVPHTPRSLLETLYGAVRPGGLLLLDTPNVARYWNRRALERGETIFQPLEEQYDCEPPWEGHHREYTAAEFEWMLQRVGCEDVDVEFVDYNMLQFRELSAEHCECLARIVEDPSQSDTLLATGRKRAR